MSDAIQQAIDALTEIKHLHQLNFELLEQLNVSCQYIVDNNIEVPNEPHLRSLLSKSLSLIAELQGKEPKTLIYKKVANESLHGDKTNGNFTEPLKLLYNMKFSLIKNLN